MLRIAGVSALVLATGCLVDSGPGDMTEMPPDHNGRICTMSMTVSGSFMETTAAPPNADGSPYTGCWPIGVWTFTATRGTTDCTTQPTLLPQYQFKGEQVLVDGDYVEQFTYMTDPTIRNRVKVSQGGDGLCEGELNLFSADGKEVWIIKPELYADKHLGGDGEYSLYGSDQWIGN